MKMESAIKRSFVLVGLAFLLGAAACGRSQGAPSVGEEGGGVPLDWNHPFHGAGIPVDSFAQAQSKIPFPLYDPKPLGSVQVFVSPGHDAVFFVYDSADYRKVWLGESLPDIPEDDERASSYSARVAENGQPDIRTTAEIVTIRGGVEALVGYSPGTPATIEWVEKGLQFVVQGPGLTKDQVLAIANSI